MEGRKEENVLVRGPAEGLLGLRDIFIIHLDKTALSAAYVPGTMLGGGE